MFIRTSINDIKSLRPEVIEVYNWYKEQNHDKTEVQEMIQDNSQLTDREKEIVTFYI